MLCNNKVDSVIIKLVL